MLLVASNQDRQQLLNFVFIRVLVDGVFGVFVRDNSFLFQVLHNRLNGSFCHQSGEIASQSFFVCSLFMRQMRSTMLEPNPDAGSYLVRRKKPDAGFYLVARQKLIG